MTHFSRRAMIAATGGVVGVLALSQAAGAQPAAPEPPEDPTKVQGQNSSPLGSRSPFESPRRLVTGSTASRTPLDALDGIITPADAAVMTRSVPLDKLMDDALIAWGQNGEALRPEQGYRMRLLLPGWEGNINIKWLRRLKSGDQPFMTREETSKYTDPMPDGSERQFTFATEAKSTITWPTPAIGSLPGQGALAIRGVAWSGRGKITRVEVSADGGQTWGDARLDDPVLPIAHTRFRFPWVWNGVQAVLQSRAHDETGYIQPSRHDLIGVRGTGSIYHYNGIQSWKVAADGKVTNVYA